MWHISERFAVRRKQRIIEQHLQFDGLRHFSPGSVRMMSEHQPPTENRAGSAARPSSVFAFPPPVPLALGSQTVINPEGRPDQREIQSPHATQVSPASSLCRILFPQPSNAETSPPSPIGLELGHFRIEDRIRSGGMGAVFRALDGRRSQRLGCS